LTEDDVAKFVAGSYQFVLSFQLTYWHFV
jgi:hypothetical protein